MREARQPPITSRYYTSDGARASAVVVEIAFCSLNFTFCTIFLKTTKGIFRIQKTNLRIQKIFEDNIMSQKMNIEELSTLCKLLYWYKIAFT